MRRPIHAIRGDGHTPIPRRAKFRVGSRAVMAVRLSLIAQPARPSIARRVVGTLWSPQPPLYRNSVYLLGTAGVSQGFGFLFWLLVARIYPDDVMGIAVTLSATILFLASASSLGLGTGLIRHLPSSKSPPRLVNSSLLVSAVVAALIGSFFLLGADVWAQGLVFVRNDPWFLLVFLVSMLAFTVALVMDHAYLAMRRAEYWMFRMGTYNLLRLPLPLAFVVIGGAFSVALAWTLPLLVSIVIGLGVFMPHVLPGYRVGPEGLLSVRQGVLRYSILNHAAALVDAAASALLPLVILNTIPTPAGAESAAHFYAALTLSEVLVVVPWAFSSSLFVEGSHAVERFASDTRKTIRVSLVLLVIGLILSVLLGRNVLELFGPQYGVSSYGAFLVLALSSPLVLLNSILATHLRVGHRLGPLVAVTFTSTPVTLVLAFLLVPSMGIIGAAVGFMVGQGVASCLFFIDFRRNYNPSGFARGASGIR